MNKAKDWTRKIEETELIENRKTINFKSLKKLFTNHNLNTFIWITQIPFKLMVLLCVPYIKNPIVYGKLKFIPFFFGSLMLLYMTF